jgi:Mce-associated membrane protein
MSPRRRIESAQTPWFRSPEPAPRRRGLVVVSAVAAAVIIAAVTISAVVFAKSQAARRDQIRDAAVLTSMRSFITQYTSPDPFNANAYAENIVKMGTGNFAKMFSDRMNEVVIQVARAEPGFGSVPEGNIGIERWNSDGSASVVAVSTMTTKMPDGTKVDSISRWEVTAVKEGDQWKVSDLIQVL